MSSIRRRGRMGDGEMGNILIQINVYLNFFNYPAMKII